MRSGSRWTEKQKLIDNEHPRQASDIHPGGVPEAFVLGEPNFKVAYSAAFVL